MEPPFKVKARHAYSSDHQDDLTFAAGQVITVDVVEDDDWYTGTCNGKQGLFPRNFVEIMADNEKEEPQLPQAVKSNIDTEAAVQHEPTASPVMAHTLSTAQTADQQAMDIDTPLMRDHATPSAAAAADKDEPAEKGPTESGTENVALASPTSNPVQSEHYKPAVEEKAKPEVKSKKSAFANRIAAFNNTADAPPVPFGQQPKPRSFVNKPYVPPPSSYVPPVPTSPKPAPAPVPRQEPPVTNDSDDEHDVKGEAQEEEEQVPKMSLKERIAMLQKQSEEEQARAEAAAERKRQRAGQKKRDHGQEVEPPTGDAQHDQQHEHEHEHTLEAAPIAKDSTGGSMASAPRRSSSYSRRSMEAPVPVQVPHAPPMEPEPEEGGETDKAEEDIDTEVTKEEDEHEQEEEEEGDGDDDEDEDEEEAKRIALRERMAKLSMGMGGGVGMGMMMPGFGAPGPSGAAGTKKKKKEEKEEQELEDADSKGPVAVMPFADPNALKKTDEPKAERVKSPPPPPPSGRDEAPPVPPVPQAPPPPKAPQAPPTPPVSHAPQAPMPPAPVPEETAGSEADEDTEEEPLSPKAEDLAERPSRPAPPPPPPSAQERPPPPPPPPADIKRESSADIPSLPPIDTGESLRQRSVDEVIEDELGDDERTESDDFSSRPAVARKGSQSTSPATNKKRNSYVAGGAKPPIPGTPVGESPPAPPKRANTYELQSPTGAPPPPPRASTMGSMARAHAPPAPAPAAPPPPVPSRQEDSDEVTGYDADEDTDLNATMDEDTPRNSMLPQHHAPPPPPPPGFAPAPPPTSAPRAPPPPPPQQQPVPPPQTHNPVEYQDDSDTTENESGPDAVPPLPQQHTSGSQQPMSAQSTGRSSIDKKRLSMDRTGEKRLSMDRTGDKRMSTDRTDKRQSVDRGGRGFNRMSSDLSRIDSPGDGETAHNLDLEEDSEWWAQPNTAPPSVQNNTANCVFEVEDTKTPKRGGKMVVTRDVYVLYQDYSQTQISVRYEQHDPMGTVSFEQEHQQPPTAPSQRQLEDLYKQFGTRVYTHAQQSEKQSFAQQNFVEAVIKQVPNTLPPIGGRTFGALIYSNMANASVSQLDEIQQGDVITFRRARFQGHKGSLHQKYSTEAGTGSHVHSAIVSEWDGTKRKVRVFEQSSSGKIKNESYKLGDLKSGEAKVFRVVGRGYVGWD